MKKSRIISNFRIEYRRKQAPYQTEIAALRWVRKFLDEFSIDHSSQIRRWQIDFYLSELKKSDCDYNDLLQAQSALRFMIDKILNRTFSDEAAPGDDSPGVFRVTG